MVQRKEATSANKNNYDEFDDKDEEMATVKIVMKGAEDKSAIRRSGGILYENKESGCG